MSSKKQALALKQITIHELEASSQSTVFVINNAKPKGNINLTVADGMGRQRNVRVPISWIPVDLTMQITRKSLLEDPQFRTLVAKRVILIIDNDAAREFLKNPDAAEEYARLYAVGPIAEVGAADESAEIENAKALVDGSIDPFVMNILVQRDMSEDDVLRELRNREDDLTKKDFQYIAQNSLHDKVKTWAAEQAL